MDPQRSDVVLLDSRQLRVLAHPLRSRLLGALRVHGPATATALAARLDTNSGQTSYHLRQLAEVGLVEDDADRGSGRDRWWRASHTSTSWVESEFSVDPGDRAAADWLYAYAARVQHRWIDAWIEDRQRWPLAWRDASTMSDYRLHLTAGQSRALADELHAVLDRYQREVSDPSGADTEAVAGLVAVFPQPDPLL